MSQRTSLILQAAQIDRRRYERLSACARKRLDPWRFYRDPNRAHRCPRPKPPLRPSDQVILLGRTTRHQDTISSLTDASPKMKSRSAKQPAMQPLPVSTRQTDILRLRQTRHKIKFDAGRLEREPTRLEQAFRQTMIERLPEKITAPVSDHVRLDMIQLAHEWGIHVYRAATITEQIIRDVTTPKHRKNHPSTPHRMAKETNRLYPALAALNQNSWLIIMITIVALINLAIFCYLF